MPKSKEELNDHLSAILKDLARENMALLNFVESLNKTDSERCNCPASNGQSNSELRTPKKRNKTRK
jgi:hypothetical protein